MAKSGLMSGAQSLPMFQSQSPVFSDPGSVFRRGEGGILPERGSRAQLDMITQLLGAGMQSARGSGSPLLAFLAPMVGGAVSARTQGLYKGAQKGRDQEAIDALLATMDADAQPNRTPSSLPNSMRNAAMSANGGPTIAAATAMAGGVNPISTGIVDTAKALGVDPVDLATAISYETAGTFDPSKRGPTTQWGQHRGLIQFGEPQAQKYGVNWSDPIGSQLGADGAVAKYLMDAGVKPGMGLMDIYSAINAGQVGLYDRSDAGNGGAPGTVRDKVQTQMGDHRQNAMRLLGGDFTAYAGAGQSPRMSQDNMRQLIGLMTNPDLSPEIRNLASTMLGGAMKGPEVMSPRDQIGLARDMLGLEQAMQPKPVDKPTYRAATPDEAAAYGARAGQIDTKTGRFYPASTGNYVNGAAATQRQQNEATTILNRAIEELVYDGLTRDEAMEQLARDPIYSPQFRILGIDPTSFGRAGAPTPNPPAQPVPPTAETASDPLGIR